VQAEGELRELSATVLLVEGLSPATEDGGASGGEATSGGGGEPQLRLSYSGRERGINFSRVRAIELAQTVGGEPPAGAAPHVLELSVAASLPGRLESITNDTLQFRTAWDQVLELPADRVAAVRVRDGRLIRLVDVRPSDQRVVPYFSLTIEPGFNTTADGEPIVVAGRQAEHGISVASRTELAYPLDGEFERLRSGFGLLDPTGALGDVAVSVLGDDAVLWARDSIKASDGLVPIEVDLTGVQRLMLRVDFGNNQHVGDRAAWFEPTLLRTAAPEGD
jgi:hypothetical protein